MTAPTWRARGVVLSVVAVLIACLSAGVLVRAPRANAAVRANAAPPVDCTLIPATAAGSRNVVSAPVREDDENPFVSFATSVFGDFVANEGTDGAGWLMNLILGNSGDQTPTPGETQILAELAQQQQQLDNLQLSVNALSDQLTDAEFAIKSQLTKSTYDELVGAQSSNIADMQTAVQTVCELSGETRVYQPDSTDIDNISSMRDNGMKYLNQLNDALEGTGGSDGILAVYSQSTWDALAPNAGAQPDQAIYTPAYLQSMRALLNYYIGLAVMFFNAYAEAVHWQSPASPGVNPLNPDNSDKIKNFYNQLTVDVNAWTQTATDDIPSIAPGMVVDTRTSPPTIWSSTPVSLPGTNAHQYCLVPAPVCSYEVLGADNNAIAAGSRLVPSVAPLPDYTSQMAPAGTWSIPTLSDWTGLVSPNGTGTAPGSGVANWAVANDIPILQSQSYATPTGPVSTIPPVVVSAISAAGTPPVLRFPTTGSAAPIHLVAATPGQDYAGQLAMVSPQTLTVPFPAAASAVRTLGSSRRAAQRFTARHRAADQRVMARAARSGHRRRLGGAPVTTGTLNKAATFSTAGTCATQAYQQPPGANAIQVSVASGPGASDSRGNLGGNGSIITSTIPAGAGATFYVQVGSAGRAALAENRQDISGGGLGGTGGGGTGGQGIGGDGGGGGGGASGLSLDSGCTQWAALAGGGGGAGGNYVAGKGGDGGGGCLSGAGCAGETPTNSDGSSATDDGAGIGGTYLHGGNSGHHHGYPAQAGSDATTFAGGDGGGGGNTDNSLTGGGGGGGGGGYGGGGGGGGSVNNYNGAGGAGGGSFVIPGVAQASLVANNDIAAPSTVTITPIIAPEYIIGLQPADQSGLGLNAVLDNFAGQTQNGNAIVRHSADGGANQEWGLLALPAASTANSDYLYELVNPASSKCVAYAPPAVNLDTCTGATQPSAPSQSIEPLPATATGLYQLQTSSSGQVIGGPVTGPNGGYAYITSSQPTQPTQLWGLELAADSIWAPPTQAGGL